MTGEVQKALAIPSAEVPYTVVSIPIPPVGPKDVLVKVEAAGLNPSEWKFRRIMSRLGIVSYPQFPGTDGAGIITEVGLEVKSGLAKGDRIAFQGWYTEERTSFQQYALVHGDLAIKIPSTMSLLEACTIPLALCTAAFGLSLPSPPVELQPTYAVSEALAKPYSLRGGAGRKGFWEDGMENSATGEPIVILGGSSSVGQFTIQIAKYLGHSPVITTSSLKHVDYLKGLGATHVIDRHDSEEAIFSEIKTILNGAELLLVYDTVDSPHKQLHIDYLSPNGVFVNATAIEETVELKDGRKVVGTVGLVHLFNTLGIEMYKNLDKFLEKGIIKPTRIEKLSGGLEGIPDGLRRLEENKVSGFEASG
ncbi:GroES-like protein [Gymnopus androsaceus JB14]|uniref:GroES-like protein n=1 Tax=Gymnopus androsaceus JB14 TaxID=1447944 RepID=A0A6A4HLI3_9AGAR|nr:GroES-like protein [Gymnopus androsaceus JB14]